MKKAATLVAGLLLVTGTVFAEESRFSFDVTGGVKYENTIFKTDKAILQHEQMGQNREDRNDHQSFEAKLNVKFNENNTLDVTVKNQDNSDKEDINVKYVHKGANTTFTAETNSLFRETDFTVLNAHPNGRVRAQIKGTMAADIYGGAANGGTEFSVSDDDDDVFLEYKLNDDMTLTFYPYSTFFGVDTVFDHEEDLGELIGTDFDGSEFEFEKVASKAGIKLAMSNGLELKFGTDAENTDDVTFFIDAMYKKTFGDTTVTVDAAFTTHEAANMEMVAAGKVETKIAEGLKLEAQGLFAQGFNDEEFLGLYAMVEYKLDAMTITGKAVHKAINGDDAILGVFAGVEYTLAEVNGVKPTVKASFEDVDLDEDGYVLKASVDAKVERDALTITPSLEVEQDANKDVVTTAKIAIAYSF